MSLNTLTAHELLDLIRQGKATGQDIMTDVVSAISATDPDIHAYVRLFDQTSIEGKGTVPIPIAIKDNLCIRHKETTCCSKILKGFVPPYNATVVDKILKSGGLLIGHTNMDEFAFGSSTETSCYGPTRNPWHYDYVVGGSSGGSAAAVAADEAIWSIGSDTGGSIRQPAAFCGIVGLKPTYGRVSRYGLIAFASSLDQIGPFTKDVTDCALLLNILAGPDERDSTCAPAPVPDYTKALINDVKNMTIGVPQEYFIKGLDPEVKAAILESVKLLESKGAKIVDVALPHTTDYAVATYYIVATAEASSNLARYDGVRFGMRHHPAVGRKSPLVDMYEETRHDGFGNEAKRRIMLGTYALSSGYYDAYYLKGLKVRTLIKQDFDKAFEHVDVVLTPTAPTTAFKFGEKINDPLAMYLSDIYTISANLSGIPAISIPCGFSKAGLPIGLQLLAKPFAEETLLRVAYTYEQNTPWHKQKPAKKKR